MVKHAGSRIILLGVASVVLHVGCRGQVVTPAGGETNWLASCGSDADCRGGGVCLCGICTKECSNDVSCVGVPASACLDSSAPAFAAACGVNRVVAKGICMTAPARDAGIDRVCPVVPLPTNVFPNCIEGSCNGATVGDVPAFTGATSVPCTDNACNPSCRRFADGATPVTTWPNGDAGDSASVSNQYAYEASCPSAGTVPQWDFLTYAATTPGNSRIVLRARMLQPGESVDGGGPWTFDLATIGSGVGGAPDECTLRSSGGTCPINLFDVLGAKAHQGTLTLEVTLVPSGADHPRLTWWEARYSCIDVRYTQTCNYGGRIWSNSNQQPSGPLLKMGGCAVGCLNGYVSTLGEDVHGPCIECNFTSDCAVGQYCDRSVTCGTGSPGPGRCLAMPTSCTIAGSKVCGCDGKTYDNECIAAEAGAGVAYNTACGASPPCWDGEIVYVPGVGSCICENGMPAECLKTVSTDGGP